MIRLFIGGICSLVGFILIYLGYVEMNTWLLLLGSITIILICLCMVLDQHVIEG